MRQRSEERHRLAAKTRASAHPFSADTGWDRPPAWGSVGGQPQAPSELSFYINLKRLCVGSLFVLLLVCCCHFLWRRRSPRCARALGDPALLVQKLLLLTAWLSKLRQA